MSPKYTLTYTEIPGFLSQIQLSEHYKLYEGYYNQTQTIPALINGISQTPAVSNVRGMQKTLQYALSGRELHELYFASMKTEASSVDDVSAEFKALVETSFGSWDVFVSDLKAIAKTCRGWYRLELDPKNRVLYHNVGDFHDEGSTAGFALVGALDMYDHAYFFDYQTNKGEYIEQWLKHLDWSMISARI